MKNGTRGKGKKGKGSFNDDDDDPWTSISRPVRIDTVAWHDEMQNYYHESDAEHSSQPQESFDSDTEAILRGGREDSEAGASLRVEEGAEGGVNIP